VTVCFVHSHEQAKQPPRASVPLFEQQVTTLQRLEALPLSDMSVAQLVKYLNGKVVAGLAPSDMFDVLSKSATLLSAHVATPNQVRRLIQSCKLPGDVSASSNSAHLAVQHALKRGADICKQSGDPRFNLHAVVVHVADDDAVRDGDRNTSNGLIGNLMKAPGQLNQKDDHVRQRRSCV
jgi:hypothetical protein